MAASFIETSGRFGQARGFQTLPYRTFPQKLTSTPFTSAPAMAGYGRPPTMGLLLRLYSMGRTPRQSERSPLLLPTPRLSGLGPETPRARAAPTGAMAYTSRWTGERAGKA